MPPLQAFRQEIYTFFVFLFKGNHGDEQTFLYQNAKKWNKLINNLKHWKP